MQQQSCCRIALCRITIAAASAVNQSMLIMWHTDMRHPLLDGKVTLCKFIEHNRSCRTCLTNWSIKKYKDRLRPEDDSIYSGVEEQLRILGADHVGYTHKEFKTGDATPFAIVGGRPFSKVNLGGYAICCRVNVTKALHTAAVAALIFRLSRAGPHRIACR